MPASSATRGDLRLRRNEALWKKGRRPQADTRDNSQPIHILPHHQTHTRSRSRFFIRRTKPHERAPFIAARDLADKAGLPLVPAMEVSSSRRDGGL